MSSPPMPQEKPAAPPPPAPIRDAVGYWRANLRMIFTLLSVWALVSLGFGVLLVEPLNRVPVEKIGMKVPLGFWFAQQGSIYVFVVLIFVYAWRMDKLDKRYGVGE